jgi:hypothetical protein
MRLPIATLACAAAALAAAAPAADAGAQETRLASAPHAAAPPAGERVIPVAATRVPALDGRDDDQVWREAQEVTAFRQFDPVEDGEAGLRTAAKVAYDARNLYVFVRAHDPHPDSIVSLLSRRDEKTASDQIKVMVDSYFDRRTGYEFAVNPAGVKRDYYMFNDAEEDQSWDAVWDVATAIDSLGWTAEFRIPLSQMRFNPGASNTFGLMIWREVARTNERISWPLFRRSKAGIVSQLAEVPGFTGLASPRRLEVTPYTVAKRVTRETAGGFSHPNELAVGADLKYGLTSNLTVDATINPDFGQVEADPAVLNLTAFEQFFQERRPFFLEGTGLFRFDLSCNDGECTGLFYSRRIGRTPQLRDHEDDDGLTWGDAATSAATTILAAAKLTGRLRNGLSVGFLDAVTQREIGVGGRTVEPPTNYLVGRLQKEFRGGNSVIGGMVTGVNRSVDEWTEPLLRREAYAAGLDFRHRFADKRYQVTGYLAGSRVAGSDSAIARTQRGSVHYYQRPGSGLPYDPSRDHLDGATGQLALEKVSGLVRLFTGYTHRTPGFEINDVGYLERADQQSYSTWVGLQYTTPRWFYRRAFVNFNQWNSWTTGGLPTGLGGNINAHAEFRNSMWGHFGIGVDDAGTVYSDREARGGPALRQSPEVFTWVGWEGDIRRAIAPVLFTEYARTDGGRTSRWSLDPGVTLRLGDRTSVVVGPSYQRRLDDSQWYENEDDATGTTHYTFGRLDQRSLGVTTRINVTATPNLSLQVYAQPFISSRDWSDLRELDDPRAASYERRFKPYFDAGARALPEDETYKQFRSNTVLRWEYRPGSVLFVVWAQGREEDQRDPGRFAIARDGRNLFRTHPDNTLLVKTSYWLSF